MEYIYQGQVRTLKEIAEMVGINAATIRSRLYRGMSFEMAVSTPIRRKGTKERCRAISADECFVCQFQDCIRKATALLEDERKDRKYGQKIYAAD